MKNGIPKSPNSYRRRRQSNRRKSGGRANRAKLVTFAHFGKENCKTPNRSELARTTH